MKQHALPPPCTSTDRRILAIGDVFSFGRLRHQTMYLLRVTRPRRFL
jgi:hypothetical protein